MSASSRATPAIVGALERASAFVEAHGDVLSRERLAALVPGAPAGRVESILGAWRCGDGGFARRSEPPPLLPADGTVSGALEALDVLDESSIRSGALVEGVVGWLTHAQASDGAWHAGPDEGLAPEDADPVFLTGMLAGHLRKLSCGSPRTLERAEEFLATRFSPDRVEDGDWRGLTAYAHVCSNGAVDLADEALQWCGRALEKGFRSGRLDAIHAARTLLLCDVQSLPGGRLDAMEVVLALLPLQASDGGFGPTVATTRERVEATVLAAHALVRFS